MITDILLKNWLGFNWSSLNKGDLVVDVAGGIGSTTMVLAKNFPDLKFIIQDMPRVIPDGVKVYII
jgi:ubiquinone/menaquinone biosynthesis C-methylase UbiE